MLKIAREERHQQLRHLLSEDPLLTDDELARQLGVSVPTIRLDRLTLGIPEVRQRAEGLARRAIHTVRSLDGVEVVGDLLELRLGDHAVSVLDTTPEMSFSRSGIIRSHHIFAQADALALAMIDGDIVLTGLAYSKFKRPVMAGERLVARAAVIRRRQSRYVVLVQTHVGAEVVFRGKFLVVAVPRTPKGSLHAHRP